MRRCMTREQGGVDVDPDHRPGAVLRDQQLIDRSQAAADVEDLAAADIAALEQTGEFLGAARATRTPRPR